MSDDPYKAPPAESMRQANWTSRLMKFAALITIAWGIIRWFQTDVWWEWIVPMVLASLLAAFMLWGASEYDQE